MDKIRLDHGGGGKPARDLIEKLISPIFRDNGGQRLLDAAYLPFSTSKSNNLKIAMTTDSFVISPLFFPGGNIGKLAACGTINDMAVSGAIPKYLSVGLIIEEGFPVKDLEIILRSLAETAHQAGVTVVTGDTKVVDKGGCDGIFINTTGLGVVPQNIILGPEKVSPGDVVIVSGTIGDHGMTILSKRENLSFHSEIKSDCAPLNDLTTKLCAVGGVTIMRDPTRGGVASVLHELARECKVNVEIIESKLPVRSEVDAGCKMLGLDPLYLANEGKIVLFARAEKETELLEVLRKHPLGKESALIGRVTEAGDDDSFGTVLVETPLGSKRILPLLEGEILPRIC